MTAITSLTELSGVREVSNLRSLLWVTPVIIGVTLTVNAIIRAVAQSLQLAPTFMPIQMTIFIPFTIVGVLAAVIVFVIVTYFSKRPYWLYLRIAIVALVLSFVPDILMLVAPMPPGSAAPPPFVSIVTVPGVISLMLMHISTAAITVGALMRFTRQVQPQK